MAIVVFVLTGVTALMCSVLLARAYRRNGIRLLLWASISFASMALEGVVLIVNEYVAADLTLLRLTVPLLGLIALLYGLLWESDYH